MLLSNKVNRLYLANLKGCRLTHGCLEVRYLFFFVGHGRDPKNIK